MTTTVCSLEYHLSYWEDLWKTVPWLQFVPSTSKQHRPSKGTHHIICQCWMNWTQVSRWKVTIIPGPALNVTCSPNTQSKCGIKMKTNSACTLTTKVPLLPCNCMYTHPVIWCWFQWKLFTIWHSMSSRGLWPRWLEKLNAFSMLEVWNSVAFRLSVSCKTSALLYVCFLMLQMWGLPVALLLSFV